MARLRIALVFGWSLLLPSASAAPRPNIVLIVADDLGHADVGFTGGKEIPTPHIDGLAAGGVRFSQGYVSHPFCSPSRAGLLTGRYQQRFGHENNPKYDPRDERSGLPTDEVTLADVLQRAGYATGAVGKWHLGAVPRFHPNARGFALFFGFIGGSHNYLPGLPGSGQYVIPLDRNGQAVDEREYLTDAFAREAVAFIERHRGGPFFLYLPFNAPHGPFQAPPRKYLDRFAGVADEHRRIYYAMVSALDDAVGRVLDALRHTGREGDTIVFFLSDNGGRREAVASSNGPLRGYKEQLLEGGIRVPFLMRWPAMFAAGRVYDRPVIALDVFATAASAAGARPPADRKRDGVDLLPFLLGRKKGPPHERLFWRTGGGAAYAVRQGDYKLVKEAGENVMLFDLARDPGETHDLAATRPAIVRQLGRAYRAWNAELIPPSFPDARADR